MKKTFKWGVGLFAAGALSMIASYRNSFISADGYDVVSKQFGIASIAFVVGAVLVFISVILFMVAVSVEKK